MSSNDKLVIASNDRNPIKAQFIATLHQAALHNQLGYMDGKDPETGEIVPLLCGVEFNEDGSPKQLWPLGIVFLNGEGLKNYLAPDGDGKYYDQFANANLEANGQPIELPAVEEEGRPSVKSSNSRKGRRRKVGADDDRHVPDGSV